MAQSEQQPDLLQVSVRVTDAEMVHKLIADPSLDLGCRPSFQLQPDGSYTIEVFAPAERLSLLEQQGFALEVQANASAVGRERQAEVGEGDRFQDGKIAPRGLGKKIGNTGKA